MHPDQIWGNDEKYSKEFQAAFKKRCEEQQNQWEESKRRYERYIESIPEEQRPGYLTKWAEEQRAQGKIINPFVQKWLDGEIAAARSILIIGMLLTVLIKGQIVIWIIMYIAYRARVKKAREDALKSDRKGL